jgi:hypothetical protein
MGPLKRVCYATMGAVTLLDLLLWSVSPIDPFDTEIIARTSALGLISAGLHLVLPRLRPHLEMPWLQRATEVFPEAFELLLFYRWVPAAITVADYLVLPGSLPFVDWWLAWPEEALGVPHWRTWPMFQAYGLLPWLERVYGSVDAQLLCMLLFFLLVKRDLHRLWEYTATVALAGSPSCSCGPCRPRAPGPGSTIGTPRCRPSRGTWPSCTRCGRASCRTSSTCTASSTSRASTPCSPC